MSAGPQSDQEVLGLVATDLLLIQLLLAARVPWVDRVYGLDRAIKELRRCAGTQFDPPMVEALVRGLDEHGWAPEAVPVFTAPDPGQVFDQDDELAFDHDDPGSLVDGQS